MELQTCTTACLGDSAMPLVIGGIVVVALIVLVVAFVLSRRKK